MTLKTADSDTAAGTLSFVDIRVLLIAALLLFQSMMVCSQEPIAETVAASKASTQTSLTDPLSNIVPEKNLERLVSRTDTAPSVDRKVQSQQEIFSAPRLLQWLLSLLFVLALIYAAAWYMKKMQGFGTLAGQRMKVISALSVGSRERVVLIQVGDTQMLVGVAPGRVNYIKDLDQPLAAQEELAKPNGFADLLRRNSTS